MSTISSAGFIAGVTNTENQNSNNVTQTSAGTASAVGATALGLTNSSGNTITSTDFGAILSAQKIAQQSITAVQTGYGILSDLTGRALLLNSEGVKEQRTPIGVTVSKTLQYIVFAIVGGLVLIAIFATSKKKAGP